MLLNSPNQTISTSKSIFHNNITTLHLLVLVKEKKEEKQTGLCNPPFSKPAFQKEMNFEGGRIKQAAEVTEGALLEYAPLKPSRLNCRQPTCLPDLLSSLQRGIIFLVLHTIFSCVLHILI